MTIAYASSGAAARRCAATSSNCFSSSTRFSSSRQSSQNRAHSATKVTRPAVNSRRRCLSPSSSSTHTSSGTKRPMDSRRVCWYMSVKAPLRSMSQTDRPIAAAPNVSKESTTDGTVPGSTTTRAIIATARSVSAKLLYASAIALNALASHPVLTAKASVSRPATGWPVSTSASPSAASVRRRNVAM